MGETKYILCDGCMEPIEIPVDLDATEIVTCNWCGEEMIVGLSKWWVE